MKKALLYTTFSVFLLLSCNTKKRVASAVNSGNYDQAITTALSKLRKNKDKKRNSDYVLILKNAFSKVQERDLNKIARLRLNDNPEYYKEIYATYTNLEKRQEAIKPLLPLYVGSKNIPFTFTNYSSKIESSRLQLAEHLHAKSVALIKSNNKSTLRNIHKDLSYLERISPNYKNTRALLTETHERGKNYIIATINNRTEQIIPRRLEEELLNFDTYGLNKFWSEYHAQELPEIRYDYAMELNLKQINISPERINEREILREREIKDGWDYEKDRNGNVVKDSLGNDIKYERFIVVRGRIYETIQTKSTQVIADVVYIDTNSQQILDTFTIDSGYVFEHIFAKYRGDKRALVADDRILINSRRVPFPSNEQMVYDSGEDLKLKLKAIISKYSLR
jgi:hypothetical protein